MRRQRTLILHLFNQRSTIIIIVLGASVVGYMLEASGKLGITQALHRQVSNPPQVVSRLPILDETSKWKTYSSTRYKYRFEYPEAFDLDGKDQSVLMFVSHDDRGPRLPIFYVDVIPPDGAYSGFFYNGDAFTAMLSRGLLTAVRVNGTVVPTGQPFGATFTRLSDVVVGGEVASVFEGYAYGKPSPNSWKDRRISINKDGYIYMIGGYYQTDEALNWFEQILSTFNFSSP